MKSYDYYKNEIEGYTDVQKTVKTIEKIAASQLHTLKSDIKTLDEYIALVSTVLTRLYRYKNKVASPLFLQRSLTKKRLAVLFVGEGGLTGGLWQRIFEFHQSKRSEYQGTLIVGKEVTSLTQQPEPGNLGSFTYADTKPTEADVQKIFANLYDRFISGEYTEIELLYPDPVSIAEQRPTSVTLLPFEYARLSATYDTSTNLPLGLPIFESPRTDIIEYLLHNMLISQLLSTALKTRLSELSARTIAMEHATQKTSDTINRLRHESIRYRRHVSTQQQIERYVTQTMV